MPPDPINRNDNDLIFWIRTDNGLQINTTTNYVTGWLDYSNAGNNCNPIYFGKARIEGTVNGIPYIWGDRSTSSSTFYRIDNPSRTSNSDNVLSVICVIKTNDARSLFLEGFLEQGPVTFGTDSGTTGSFRGIGFDDFNRPNGDPGLGFSVRGPSTFIKNVSQFFPDKIYVICAQMFENNARGIVHINGELIPSLFTDYHIMSGGLLLFSPKRITEWIQGGMNTNYALSGGGIFEVLALRRALSSNEIANFQNYVTQKYNILPDPPSLSSSQNFISNDPIKDLRVGNNLVRRVFIDKKINYFFKRYETLASFGSGSNNGSILITPENEPEFGITPSEGTYQTNDFIYFKDVNSFLSFPYWWVRFSTPFLSYGGVDVLGNKFGIVVNKSESSNILSFSIPRFELGNFRSYENVELIGDNLGDKPGYEKNIFSLYTTAPNVGPGERVDYFMYTGSVNIEVSNSDYRVYELLRFIS